MNIEIANYIKDREDEAKLKYSIVTGASGGGGGSSFGSGSGGGPR